ncbi:MAG: hypothetical protein FWE10_08345 [Rikenellaceae bacterium]|nr:hypothetical protein [Rikenellaceae bacterium]
MNYELPDFFGHFDAKKPDEHPDTITLTDEKAEYRVLITRLNVAGHEDFLPVITRVEEIIETQQLMECLLDLPTNRI